MNKLKDLRLQKGVTQFELAAYLYIKQNTYSQYENERRQLPVDIMIKLSRYYEVSLIICWVWPTTIVRYNYAENAPLFGKRGVLKFSFDLFHNQVYKIKGAAIDKPTVGDTKLGQARQGDKRHRHTRRGQGAAHILPSFREICDLFVHYVERLVAHQARNRQLDFA